MPLTVLGLALGLAVGFVLGLLGGGGSILAVPILTYVFHFPPKSAIAMSLAVVSMSAFVGFLTHWRQGSVALRIAIPFALFAVVSAFAMARVARFVPEEFQLGLFALFAMTAAVLMLRDSMRATPVGSGRAASETASLTPLLALEAIGVGALTSLIGAGGGFIIVPALVFLARVPVKPAVGSSLLIITLNAMGGFAGYIGQVEIDWAFVTSFTVVAASGAILGSRLNRHVPQNRIKQAFALLIIVLGAYLIVREVLAR